MPLLDILTKIKQTNGGFADAAPMASSFNLLELPPELRLEIYEAAFTTSTLIQPPLTGHHGDGSPWGGYPPVDRLPHPNFPINLLRTCHRICAEALGVLYGCNTFQLHFPANSEWSHYTFKFLKQIGTSNCALLKSAEIFFHFPHYFSAYPTSTRCNFPKRSISSLTGLKQANVIVATSREFTLFRIENGDGDYLRRMVYLLRRSLPEDCSLKWDVTGGFPHLEKALDEVYGLGGYQSVQTETKRRMILLMGTRCTRGVNSTIYNANGYTGNI
jgi:hypothetical protein